MSTENRPVLTGLVALVGVAVAIGVLGGLGVLLGVKATGLDGAGQGSSDDSSAPETFRLPRPSDTESSIPDPVESEESVEAVPGETETATPTEVISLSASQQSVSPMQQIDLTGTYQAGEGAILQVQRFENGAWSDFPVTMSVSGGTFATYVQTSQGGPNRFRVVDTDTQVASNEITVTVG